MEKQLLLLLCGESLSCLEKGGRIDLVEVLVGGREDGLHAGGKVNGRDGGVGFDKGSKAGGA